VNTSTLISNFLLYCNTQKLDLLRPGALLFQCQQQKQTSIIPVTVPQAGGVGVVEALEDAEPTPAIKLSG